MNRQAFQNVAKLRKKEAAALLRAKLYAGAYYLTGYTIECALKACIAKQTRRFDFPNKKLANDAHIHDLEKLLELAGLKHKLKSDMETNRNLELNWSIIKDWKETARYSTSITLVEARDMYSACASRANGIFNWISKQW